MNRINKLGLRKARTVLTFSLTIVLVEMASVLRAQTTVFSNPVGIQSGSGTAAALTVDSLGSQPAVVDLFANGNADEIRFFADTPTGTFQRSYFNSQGAFYTNSWMVISGSYTPQGSSSPTILPPTNDPFMLGILSDVPGPALVIRSNDNNQQWAAAGISDSQGNYRLAIQADGSMRFAGTGLYDASGPGTPFAETNFDTNLYRAGAGELRTDSDFSAQNYSVNLLNNSGASVASGTVLSVSGTADDAFTVSTTDSDPEIAGIALTTIGANALGPIVTHGIVSVSVVAPVVRGALLVSAGNGSARALQATETPAPGAIIGKAVMMSTVPSGSVQQINAMINIL